MSIGLLFLMMLVMGGLLVFIEVTSHFAIGYIPMVIGVILLVISVFGLFTMVL